VCIPNYNNTSRTLSSLSLLRRGTIDILYVESGKKKSKRKITEGEGGGEVEWSAVEQIYFFGYM